MTTASPHSHQFNVAIPHSHPSLPGHFPGLPVVPGVLLLEEVIRGAELWLQQPLHVRELPQVKFIAALLPEDQAQVHVQLQAGQLRFAVRRNEQLIAQGAFGLARMTP